jgi:hypothetical protein
LLASTVVELPESRPNGTSDDADLLRYCTRERRSHRLLKFEHELVDRLAARRLDREVARILGVAPEIAFGALRLLCNKDRNPPDGALLVFRVRRVRRNG